MNIWGIAALILAMYAMYRLVCIGTARKFLDADPTAEIEETEFFPHEIKPVNLGQYKTRFQILSNTMHEDMAVWDGSHWMYEGRQCYIQNREWCGLTEQPIKEAA